jgi:muconolactone delta-isomerase
MTMTMTPADHINAVRAQVRAVSNRIAQGGALLDVHREVGPAWVGVAKSIVELLREHPDCPVRDELENMLVRALQMAQEAADIVEFFQAQELMADARRATLH